MGITKDELLVELANLEQQNSKHRSAIEKSRNDLEAVGGALQLVNYLLKKLDEKEEVKSEPNAEEAP